MRSVLPAVLLAALSTLDVGAQLPSCSVGGAGRECQIPPRSVAVVAQDSIGGDMEFAGHPVWIEVQAARRLTPDSSALVVHLQLVAIEIVMDSTWMAGADTVVLFEAEPGWRIKQVPEIPLEGTDRMTLMVKGKEAVSVVPREVAADRRRHEGLCRHHASDVCTSTTDRGLVARWTVWGDSGERDLGRTRMAVDLASLGLRVERRPTAVVSGRAAR